MVCNVDQPFQAKQFSGVRLGSLTKGGFGAWGVALALAFVFAVFTHRV